MSDRVPVEWLGDAREYALEARNLANGLTQAAFESDRRSQFAVCFCLVIVGEALNRIPKDVGALAPEISWTAVNGLRNRLVHAYWLIDTEIILRIVQADIPALISSIERLIEKIK